MSDRDGERYSLDGGRILREGDALVARMERRPWWMRVGMRGPPRCPMHEGDPTRWRILANGEVHDVDTGERDGQFVAAYDLVFGRGPTVAAAVADLVRELHRIDDRMRAAPPSRLRAAIDSLGGRYDAGPMWAPGERPTLTYDEWLALDSRRESEHRASAGSKSLP